MKRRKAKELSKAKKEAREARRKERQRKRALLLQQKIQERRKKAELVKMKRRKAKEIIKAKKEAREIRRKERQRKRALLLQQKREKIKAARAAKKPKILTDKNKTTIHQIHVTDQGSSISKFNSSKVSTLSDGLRSSVNIQNHSNPEFAEMHEPGTFRVDLFKDVLIGPNGTVTDILGDVHNNLVHNNSANMAGSEHTGEPLSTTTEGHQLQSQEMTTAADPQISKASTVSYLDSILDRIWRQIRDFRKSR